MYQFKLGDFLTYEDWQLSLSSYKIGEPDVKTNYIDIPYADGSIDLSEALTGGIVYGDRVIEAIFEILGTRKQIQDKFSTIKKNINGLKTKVIAPEDSDYYYIGRIFLLPLENKNNTSRFEMNVRCEPYKYKKDLTVVNVSVGGVQEVILSNEQKRAVPKFVSDADVQVVFGNGTYTINAGTHTLPIVLEMGNNTIQLSGTANVVISYQEGVL